MPSAGQFIAAHRVRWTRLEALLARSEGNGLRHMTASDLDALGSEYRALMADLAVAQRDFPADRATALLNQLASRAHMRLYQAPSGTWRRIGRTFTVDFADRFRAAGHYVAVAALLLFVPAVWAYLAALFDPTLRATLVPAELRAVMQQGKTWTDMAPAMRPLMAPVLFTHNIQIAFLSFGGGILMGLGSVYVLVENGLQLGAVLGAAQHYGVGSLLWAFISPHGTIEITSILIASAGGLMIGDALLRPGPLRRRDAATRAARGAVELVLGTVPLLVIAGLIEGFVSPSSIPALVKFALGPLLGVVLYALLLTLGRKPSRSRDSSGPSDAPALLQLQVGADHARAESTGVRIHG